MRATGLGFDELAQTIRGISQDMSTTTTSGINAIENIKNSQINREQVATDIANINADVKSKGLQLEADQMKLADAKRKEAELNAPISMETFFSNMTQSGTPEEKIVFASKIPAITKLLGWTIDENDSKAPMKKADGSIVSYRDAAKASRVVGAFYTNTMDPFVHYQKCTAAAKAELQKFLPDFNLGPGLSIEQSVLNKLKVEANAGKLPKEITQAIAKYTLAKDASDYALSHPKEVFLQQISHMNQIAAAFKTWGGDTTQIDEWIKEAKAEADKLPVGAKAVKITGIEEGTMLDPKEIVTLGGHVAGYNQGIDTQKMRDATSIKTTGMSVAGQERAANRQGERENKIALINNIINQMNRASERASKDAQAMAEKAVMSGQAMAPEKIKELTDTLTIEYQGRIAQNLYDILGKERMIELQIAIPESVDQSTKESRTDDKSTEEFRAKVRPAMNSVHDDIKILADNDPFKRTASSAYAEVNSLIKSGNEQAALEKLNNLQTQIQKNRESRQKQIKNTIVNKSKGFRLLTIDPEYQAIN